MVSVCEERNRNSVPEFSEFAATKSKYLPIYQLHIPEIKVITLNNPVNNDETVWQTWSTMQQFKQK